MDITEKIKTFQDACKATGRPEFIDLSNFPEDLREYFEGQYQMVVIAEALNEGWKPNWNDNNEPKHYVWFWKPYDSPNFALSYTYHYFTNADAGNNSRICFKSRELAEYAGRQFIEIWNKILLK